MTFFISCFIERGEFILFIGGISLAFSGYFYLILKGVFTKKQLVFWSIFFRVIVLFNTPNLSDDYYRFIWDGELITQGENPYLHLPSELILTDEYKNSKFYHELYEGLNSKQYYTVYQPLNQIVFGASSFIGGGNIYIIILALKLILLLFEIGILFIFFKLLKALKLAENLAIIYGFNPLVILELVGNIHFEGMMLFFFLFGVLMLIKNRIIVGGVLFALAISIKMIPLMLLPLVLGLIGWKKSIKFYLTIGLVSIVLFLPFMSNELLSNFGSSIDLYFQKFEFNASFYYVFRWVGIELTGYNQIGVIGTILPLVIMVSIAFFTIKQLREKNKQIGFIQNTFYVLFVYYLLASIVHPWYVINLVVLSVFIQSRVGLIWSFTVLLSYFAYSNYIDANLGGDKHQSILYFFLVFIEYFVLLGYLLSRRFLKNKA
jgi:alpha-1,6-mannosyltransferase